LPLLGWSCRQSSPGPAAPAGERLTRRWHKAVQQRDCNSLALLYGKCRNVLLRLSMRNEVFVGCKMAVKSRDISDFFATCNIPNTHKGEQGDREELLKGREMDICVFL